MVREVFAANRLENIQNKVELRKLAGSGFLTTGRINIVKSTDDADRREVQGNFPAGRIFNNIPDAIANCRQGSGDYVLICPKRDGLNWEITASLTANRINLHLIGIGGRVRPKINATGVIALKVSSVGIEVAGLDIESTQDTAVDLSNENHWIHDCRLRGGTVGGYDFRCNSGGKAFDMDRCTLGNTSDHDAETCIDFTATSGAGTTIITDCVFLHKAEAVGDEFILAQSGATFLIARRCMFYNAAVGSTDMTVAITAVNRALAVDCMAIGATTMLATGKLTIPGGMMLTTLASDVFNPALAIDGAEPVAADSP